MKLKDFGINVISIYCPKCKAAQPKMRIPKSWKEMLWGGNTCSNCNRKMDKYGNLRN